MPWGKYTTKQKVKNKTTAKLHFLLHSTVCLPLSLSHPLRRAFVSQQQQQVKVCASAECRLPMERKTRKNSISKCVDACPYVGFLCLGANCTTPLVTFCLASVPPILCAEREETGQFAGRCVFDHFRKRNASSRSACRSPKQIYNKIKKVFGLAHFFRTLLSSICRNVQGFFIYCSKKEGEEEDCCGDIF